MCCSKNSIHSRFVKEKNPSYRISKASPELLNPFSLSIPCCERLSAPSAATSTAAYGLSPVRVVTCNVSQSLCTRFACGVSIETPSDIICQASERIPHRRPYVAHAKLHIEDYDLHGHSTRQKRIERFDRSGQLLELLGHYEDGKGEEQVAAIAEAITEI